MRRSAAGYRVLEQRPGLFGEIWVLERDARRRLRFGSPWGIDQSVFDTRRPERPGPAYLRALGLAARLRSPPLRTALLVGLGGGGAVHLLRAIAPRCRIVVIEADSAVIDVARRWFGIRPDRRLRLEQADALDLADQRKGATASSFDLILHDTYDCDALPDPLATTNFLTALRDRLAATGLLVVNLGMPSVARELPIVRRFAKIFPSPGIELRMPTDHNRLLIGSPTPLPAAADVRRLARGIDARRELPFPVLPFGRLCRPLPRPALRRGSSESRARA